MAGAAGVRGFRKVALDCRLLAWPGIGRYCRELARALIAAAPDIEFHWLVGRVGHAELPLAANARPLVVEAPPFSIREQLTIPRVLRRHGIRLFHAPTSNTWPLLVPRLVVTVHDLILRRFPEFLPNPIGRAYYALMTRAALARAVRVIAVSRFTARDLAESWPQVAARTRVVWNGVSSHFQPVTDAKVLAETRSRLRLPGFFLLYVGTRKRHKNLPRLLEAYGHLAADQRARCRLVLVTPPDARYLEVDQTVRAMNLARDLVWIDRVDERDLATLYTLARCVVLVSLHEGFGLPIVEAHACGTPALVAAEASLPEIAGDACMLVNPRDTESIRDGLARMIEDDDRHAALAAKALANARRFRWEDTAGRVAAVYREVLA
jgi:glycosyltransferase involved in cell wall biosynthesis